MIFILLKCPFNKWSGMLMRGGGDNEIGGRQGRSLQENYFSNLFFNNIYIFSLNNKTTEILGYLIIFSVMRPQTTVQEAAKLGP
jgi:hypothetical protein